MPRISVIISNFNGARFLPRLLETLKSQRDVETEMIVVDRRSTDESAQILRAHPEITVLSEPPESGLVAGYHVGAARATSELLFFCNEDMWFDPECLSRLAAGISMQRRIAAADGWHWTYDGKEWLHGGTRFTGTNWAVNSPHPRRAADFQVALPAGDLVPFPCAGAFLMHRDAYRDIGGWDGSFFLDHEDIDLFVRAWQRRWKCVSVPEAKIYHALNASKNQTLTAINQSVTQRRYVSQRANMAVIALKYFTWPGLVLAALHWPVVFANNVVKLHWQRAGWDFLVLRELARRFRATWTYRRTYRPYLRYFPGERFFQLPEFSK